ncbi:MAG: purine-binding chemotaxis protein CheW [Magnetococcales bacterium]|nr:purine-binding chemotaxis protein CheW [Magnetococcales bacterium]
METDLITQFLTFQLGAETFAIPIANVREVLKMPDMTAIPGSPEFLRGVINVRGNVVPVVDLKRKFGQPATVGSRKTRVIIVESTIREKNMVLGALADSVEEVLDLPQSQVEPAPQVGIDLKTEYIRGIGKLENRFVILLDVHRVFSEEELILLDRGQPREGH